MGVYGFLSWITNRYPFIVKRFDDPSRPHFDVLFIDFNPLIYYAIEYYKETEINSWFNNILRFLDLIVQNVRPSSLLYIAVDGTAPFAKNKEQRRRRKNSSIFRSQISIGTEFMESLHQRLLFFLKEQKGNNKVWQTPQVIYSSYRTPGEGEHKFFDFLQAARKNDVWNENASVCLYSVDADLLFMAMQLNMKKCCLLTYTNSYNMIPIERGTKGTLLSKSDFLLIYPGIIMEYLSIEFSSILNGNNEHLLNIIDDFSAISYLLGNDFIPSFCDLDPSLNDFPNALEVYKKNFKGFLVDGYSFNLKNLADFLRVVASTMSLKADGNEKIQENEENLAKYVVEAFYFVLKYYKDELPSWKWQYPGDLAPSLESVADYISNMKEIDIPKFQKSEPLSPIEQLVSILPPSSESLVPKCLSHLLSNDSVISDIEKLQNKIRTFSNQLTKEEIERNTLISPFVIFKDELLQFDIKKINLHQNTERENPFPSLELYRDNLLLDISIGESISIRIKNKHLNDNLSIGQTVLVDWPFLKPAIIISISDSEVFVKYIQFADIHDSSIGNSDRIFSFPISSVVTNHIEKYLNKFKAGIIPKFSSEQKVFLHGIGCGFYDIEEGTLKGHAYHPIDFNNALLSDDSNWITLSSICHKYQINDNILTKLLGKIQPLNIGFNVLDEEEGIEFMIKYNSDNHLIISGELSHLIDNFIQEFPNFINKLKIIDEPQNLALEEQEIKTIIKWISDQNISLEMIELHNSLPSKATLNQIESLLIQKNNTELIPFSKNVKEEDLIWPGKGTNLERNEFKPGLRVICIAQDGLIPFGTILTFLSYAKDKNYAICLSDNELEYGETFHSVLSTKRGAIIPICDLENYY